MFVKYLVSGLYTLFARNLNIEEKIQNYILKHTSDIDQIIGIPTWTGYVCTTFDKKLFEELVEHEFEDHKLKIPKCYDEILSRIYGDYMTLPPLEQRKPHHHYRILKKKAEF